MTQATAITNAAPSPVPAAPRAAGIDPDARCALERMTRGLRYTAGIWFGDVPPAAREAVLDALHERADNPLTVATPADMHDQTTVPCPVAAAPRAAALDPDTRYTLERMTRVLRYAAGIWFDDVPPATREAVLDALHERADNPLTVATPADMHDLAGGIQAILRGDAATDGAGEGGA